MTKFIGQLKIQFETQFNIYRIKKMAANFDTEIRESNGNKYLKVFIRDISKIGEVQGLLNNLPSVRVANITASQSANNPSQTLTIYPKRVYSIEEVDQEIKSALTNYYNGSPLDPIFENQTISSLGDNAYRQILGYINMLGKGLEKYKALNSNFDEERSRDYFLPFLNTISRNHTASGEAFNRNGKTDILIQDQEGNNVFIAECKVWRGKEQLSKAVDQLLDRYVSWRDEKVALIVFNKDVANFTEVIQRAKEAISSHPSFKGFVNESDPTSISCLFKNPQDENQVIKLELILFNFT